MISRHFATSFQGNEFRIDVIRIDLFQVLERFGYEAVGSPPSFTKR